MALSTVGLAIGAVILAVGLVLVLLPQDFSGSATVPPLQTYYRVLGDHNVGLVTIPVVGANLAIGGASLTITYMISNNTPAAAYLYTQIAGEGVYDGAQGQVPNITWAGGATSGSLTDSGASPGVDYVVLFYAPNGTTPTISVSWNGAVDFPYAYAGIPLVIAGAIILVAVVSFLPQKPEPAFDSGAGVPVQEAYIYESPMVMVDTPPAAALPAPADMDYSPVPTPPPQFAPRPSASPPVASPPAPEHKGHWKPIPLHRSTDSESSPSHHLFHRSAVSSSATSTPPAATTGVATAAAPVAGDGRKCPRCRLPVGDASWAFCPRCRMELP